MVSLRNRPYTLLLGLWVPPDREGPQLLQDGMQDRAKGRMYTLYSIMDVQLYKGCNIEHIEQ